MILREATIRYKGYDPLELTVGSHKRICVICDKCGRVRYVEFCQYRDLCKPCSMKGEGNPMFRHKYTNETKNKMSKPKSKEHKINMSKNHANVKGENNPQWKGGISGNRDHVLPINQCIKINDQFKNSEFHHITKSIGIYIPKILHRHISHNLLDGKNMKEINMLSLQFIEGDYNI